MKHPKTENTLLILTKNSFLRIDKKSIHTSPRLYTTVHYKLFQNGNFITPFWNSLNAQLGYPNQILPLLNENIVEDLHGYLYKTYAQPYFYIYKLYKQFLITFNVYVNKTDMFRANICFTLEDGGLSVFLKNVSIPKIGDGSQDYPFLDSPEGCYITLHMFIDGVITNPLKYRELREEITERDIYNHRFFLKNLKL